MRQSKNARWMKIWRGLQARSMQNNTAPRPSAQVDMDQGDENKENDDDVSTERTFLLMVLDPDKEEDDD